MSGRHICRRLEALAVLVVFLLCGKAAYGQTQAITATLNGTIIDASGQPITGARVTLASPERGISRVGSTGNTGLYIFTLLPPGVYLLQVEVPGFKKYRQEGITLEAGQTAEQNVQLAIGAVSETVEVSAQAPLMNADNANISSDISARRVVELPLNLRNVISLAELNSSVSNTAEE
jgi:hypothetical protein